MKKCKSAAGGAKSAGCRKKIILGLVGEIASGKDTVADYLKKNHHSATISFSQPLREILDRLHLPQNRENMARLGADLRRRFGQDILAKTITAEAQQNPAPIITLPNVRLPQDIKYLKKLPHFVFVAIETDAKTRYRRLIKRGQNTDDKTKSWPQFLRDSRLPTEIKIRSLAQKARFKLDNNGDLAGLYAQIENLLAKIAKK